MLCGEICKDGRRHHDCRHFLELNTNAICTVPQIHRFIIPKHFTSIIAEEVKNSMEAQTEINQLKSEAEKRQMEDLKKAMQQKINEVEEQTKEIDELKATLSGRKEELMARNGELQELKNDLNHLKSLFEVKSTEADESMDKYCSLMVQVHKLEKTNEALTTRLAQLSAKQNASSGNSVRDCGQHPQSTRKSAIKPQEENLEVRNENTSTSAPLRSPQGSKRGHSDLSDKDRAQETLPDLNLTKKIKVNLVNAAKERTEEEDEDFRPEGLPELVQKGNLVHN